MIKFLVALYLGIAFSFSANAQWNGHSNASDLTTPINRTGNVTIGSTSFPLSKFGVFENNRYYHVNRMVGGYISTEESGGGKNYILLHRAYSGTNVDEHHVMGKLTGIRGGLNAWNRKWTVEVNTATAYQTTRGSMMSYNETFTKLVTLTYESELYLALEITSTSSLTAFSFTGYARNEKLQLVRDEEVSNIVEFSGTGLDPISVQGNFGVGTSSPTAKLDVNGGAKFGSVVESPTYNDHVVIRSDGNIPTEGGMIFTNSDATTAYGMKMVGSFSGTNNPTFRMGVVNLATPNTFTRDYLFFNDNKMGVRSIMPLTDLHISSPSLGGKANDPSPTNGLLISCDGSGTALNMGVYATGPQYSWIQSRSKATAATPVMMNLMINPWGGNVAIGTTTADQKLTVDGIVKCEEVRVEVFTGTGPDYVFAPDYNLLPLSEVESYIKANKHLPEVPSAKQMEEEGLNLKEMNLLLLKKVEELTLHLIELKKENADLQGRVKNLENQ